MSSIEQAAYALGSDRVGARRRGSVARLWARAQALASGAFVALLVCCAPAQDVVAGGELRPDGSFEPVRCTGDDCTCALPRCTQICDAEGERLCPFECLPDTDCANVCAGGGCSLQCGANASCSLDCDGGNCWSRCDGSTSCDIGCEAGGCTTTCVGSERCALDCPGGGCRLTCEKAERCEITGCAEGCALDCGGAKSCDSSCKDGPGCSISP